MQDLDSTECKSHANIQLSANRRKTSDGRQEGRGFCVRKMVENSPEKGFRANAPSIFNGLLFAVTDLCANIILTL